MSERAYENLVREARTVLMTCENALVVGLHRDLTGDERDDLVRRCQAWLERCDQTLGEWNVEPES